MSNTIDDAIEINDDYIPISNSFIYILQLEKGKFYVGYTERKDGERFTEHFTGKGSEWTKTYKPIQVMEWRHGTLDDEDRITLEMMDKYGWWNVRGGKWCSVIMEKPPIELFKAPETSIFTKLVSLATYIFSGPSTTDVPSRLPSRQTTKQNSSRSVCFRCGRNSHLVKDCYAKTHLNGRKL